MTIPIIHGGKRIGVLETRREGAYTRFEARCAFLPGVRRLFLYGGGGSAPLGVLQPEGGSLVLRRRLSRAATAQFPPAIEYAGFEEARSAAETETPKPREREEGGGAVRFVTEDGARFLALPCALRRAVPGTRVREIDGKRYLLFRTCD